MSIGPTITQIKDYLTSADLRSKVTGGENTVQSVLDLFITPEGIDSQIRMEAPVLVKTCWWIEYSEVSDTFVFKVGTFDNSYNPISYQAYEDFFKEQVISTNEDGTTVTKEAVVYDDSKKVFWTRNAETNSYEINENNTIRNAYLRYLQEKIPTIIKLN